MERRKFIRSLGLFSLTGLPLSKPFAGSMLNSPGEEGNSGFYQRLTPLHRLLEMENWYVWGTSPITSHDGKATYLFTAMQGGKHNLSSSFLFKID